MIRFCAEMFLGLSLALSAAAGTFRRAYDQLQGIQGDRADIDYVRLLHLAAQVGESRVAEAIVPLLDQPSTFDYAAVRACVAPPRSVIPNLRAYDALLVGASA